MCYAITFAEIKFIPSSHISGIPPVYQKAKGFPQLLSRKTKCTA